MQMKELTKAQEEILQAIWEIREGAVSDVLNVIPEPKPAYNTVATVIKVLENKGYVAHRTFGKTNVYFSIIDKNKYAEYKAKNVFRELYDHSLNRLVSPFIKSNQVSLQELEELKELIEKEIVNKKK